MPEGEKDYLKKVAIPYYTAVKTWLETIKIGMDGNELYDKIEEVLPKAQYGWSLNPGHLCADEEWLASPVYKGSGERIKSGMLFQIDIIPAVPGYGGISCESGVMLADKALREAIKKRISGNVESNPETQVLYHGRIGNQSFGRSYSN